MRRVSLIFSMLLLVVTISTSTAPTGAAKGREGEPLFVVNLDNMPPSPTPAALARITFAPGSGLSMTANPGPALHFVEEGRFDVLMLGGGALERRGRTAPDQATPVVAGAHFTISPGDLLVIPANTPFEVFNTGTTPSIALIIEFFARDLNAPLPDGIDLDPLVVGTDPSMPSGFTTVVLTRTTLESSQSTMPAFPHSGPALIYIEAGQAIFKLSAGDVQVAPGAPTTGVDVLPSGSSIFQRTDAMSFLTNSGNTPLSFLVLSIQSRSYFHGGPAATPVPT